MAVAWQAVIVGILAGFVGLSELVSRYRSDPGYVLTHSLAAWLYIVVNGGAGVAALFLIRAFGWFDASANVDLWRVLIASFGALAFFRSSLFLTKIGGSTIGVGPSLVLGALLDACDREVDRRSAEKIADIIASDLDALDPRKVMFGLPILSLALMQNFSAGDQAQLGAELAKLRSDSTITPQTQMRAVIVQLAKYLGPDLVGKVLRAGRPIFVEEQPRVATALVEQVKKEVAEQQARDAQERPRQ